MTPKTIVPICTAVIAVLSFLLTTGTAAPTPPTVAVVDFYAPTPVPEYAGVVPERYAANDLSGMLARAAGDRLVPISRATVERAEADLRWHADDVLRFARLSALSQSLHADRLVVGWIAQFAVGHEPSNEVTAHGGGGPITGYGVVVVQVFDAAEGRLVAQTRAEGNGLGGLSSLVAEQTLHEALQPTMSFLVSTLTSPSPY